jgi:hypothetical protein
LVNPETTAFSAGGAICRLIPAGAPAANATTLYLRIGLPPSEAGASQETVAEALPAIAEMPVGSPGAVPGAVAAAEGVTAFDGADAPLSPAALMAWTTKV